MAVTYVAKTEVKVDSGTSIQISIPAGWSVGDLLICCIAKDDDYEITPPAGWIVIQNINSGTAMRLWTGYRIAEAGDTNWTWTGDSEAYYGVILLYSGASATPIHASGSQTETGENPTAPSVAFTNLTAGSRVLQVFGADRNGWEFTIPPELTERFKDYIAGAGGCGGAGGDMAVVDGWVSPTGHVDPDTAWVDEDDAYDEKLLTNSRSDVSPNSWSSYLELTIDAVSCSKVRFWATYDVATINQISLDVYYLDAWHNIYEGIFTRTEWVEKEIGSTQTVTAMRVKFYNDDDAVLRTARLFEADFWAIGVTTGETNMAVFTQAISEEWAAVTAVIEAAVVAGLSMKWNGVAISKWNGVVINKLNGVD